MFFFDGFIVNTIFILFPLFLYLIYVAYQNNINKDINNNIFEIALFSSLYLISKYGLDIDDSYVAILINIPLLFAYLKGRKLSAFIISIIIVMYSTIVLKHNMYFAIGEYCVYYILYLYSSTKNITSSYIINGFIVIKAFILSFLTFYFISPTTNLFLNLFNVFFSLLIFYSATICYYKLIQKIEDIINLNVSLKELEREKTIRNSLFKITHEIKNPIAVCKGYLDMIDINNSEKLEKYLKVIKSEMARTLTLMDDFLDYSKIRIEKDIIDVVLVVEETCRAIEVLLKDQGGYANFNIIDDEVYIMGDFNRLKQVLINIFKNSLESRLPNTKLTVGLDMIVNNNNLDIIISDNGEGMTEEELSKIGEVFYTTKPKGTGIGVNLSKEIIDKHGGSIKYESEKFKGTKVTISLPIDIELN